VRALLSLPLDLVLDAAVGSFFLASRFSLRLSAADAASAGVSPFFFFTSRDIGGIFAERFPKVRPEGLPAASPPGPRVCRARDAAGWVIADHGRNEAGPRALTLPPP